MIKAPFGRRPVRVILYLAWFTVVYITSRSLIGVYLFLKTPELTKIHDTMSLATRASSLLLLTYGRSGSTFTADILRQSPDVFYLFEPFWTYGNIQDVYSLSKQIPQSHDSMTRLPKNVRVVVDDISNLLTCDFNEVQTGILNRLSFDRQKSKQHQLYVHCLKTHPKPECVKELSKICEKLPVKLIKTVRLSMNIGFVLLKRLKGLKIIHLLRDPRGTLESMRYGGFTTLSSLKYDAFRLCERMISDINAANMITRDYPDQYIKIYYEDLAQDPQSGMKLLFDFSGLNFTTDIQNNVQNMTHSKGDNGYYNTVRKNSSDVPSKWRKTLPKQYIGIIDNACADLYKVTPYRSG